MLLHVFLHLALCNSMSGLPAGAPVEVHVRISDKVDRAVLDQVFETSRGSGGEATVAFDIPWGVYRLEASVPARDCNAVDYIIAQPDRNRTIAETLHDGPAPAVRPVLVFGTGPQSFHDAKPQFVFLDAQAVECQFAVPDPLPSRVAFEHEGDAYYATVYAVPAGVPSLLALRLQTPEHAYQYVSVVELSPDWAGWPTTIQFNVTQKQMALLEGKAADTLFCPPQNVTQAN